MSVAWLNANESHTDIGSNAVVYNLMKRPAHVRIWYMIMIIIQSLHSIVHQVMERYPKT